MQCTTIIPVDICNFILRAEDNSTPRLYSHLLEELTVIDGTCISACLAFLLIFPFLFVSKGILYAFVYG